MKPLKLVAGIAFVVLVCAASMFGLVQKIEREQLAETRDRLYETAELIAPKALEFVTSTEQTSQAQESLHKALRAIESTTKSRVQIFDPKDSNRDSFPAEVQALLRSTDALSNSKIESRGLTVYLGVTPELGGLPQVVVSVESSVDVIFRHQGLLRGAVLQVVLLLSAAGFVVGLLLFRNERSKQRLVRLENETSKVGETRGLKVEVEGNDELAGIGRNFNHLVGKLETKVAELEEEKAKTKVFLENVAHELKTPMTGLSGSLESLLTCQLDGETQNVMLHNIEKETERLSSLTGKLLELQKLDYDQLQVQNFDLLSVAETVVDSYAGAARKAGVELRLESGVAVSVQGDLEKIQRVVENLLENAIRCTPEGKSVIVAVFEGPDGPQLSIQDEGPGPPSEELFKRHSQGKRSPGSLGLGLAIASEIVERHGHKLRVESAEPGGSLFSFQLSPRHKTDT